MRIVIPLLAIVAIVGIAATNGWLTYSNTDGEISVGIDKQEVADDTKAASKAVSEAAENTGDALKSAGDEVSDAVSNDDAPERE